MSDSPETNASKRKGKVLKKVESEGAEELPSPSQRLEEVISKYAAEFRKSESREQQNKHLNDWRLRMAARGEPVGNPWTSVYEEDRLFRERSKRIPSTEAVAPAVALRKEDRDATATFSDDFVDEGVVMLQGIPQLEDVMRALEEIRQDCHYDGLSHRIPGVSNRSLSALRWSLINDPSLIRQALDPKPRNLAILAARRVAFLLGRGFRGFDPAEEISDDQSLASKAEILLVMEHVCPNAFTHVPTEKRALAKWWGDCGLKNHPESRGYAPGWGPAIRRYFGIPNSIP